MCFDLEVPLQFTSPESWDFTSLWHFQKGQFVEILTLPMRGKFVRRISSFDKMVSKLELFVIYIWGEPTKRIWSCWIVLVLTFFNLLKSTGIATRNSSKSDLEIL